VRLTEDEQRMLDGEQGPARQKAMDLLLRYGEALGAERLVDTNNVCATVGATTPFIRDFAAQHPGGLDAVFSEFSTEIDKWAKVVKFSGAKVD
jgi:hypothetical protein